MTGAGNTEQIRVISEHVADTAIERFAARHPEFVQPPPPEVPPVVKWLVGSIAGLGSAAMIGMAFWIVSTLSSLQQTVTRIDERQQMAGANTDKDIAALEQRVTTLEGFHRKDPGK